MAAPMGPFQTVLEIAIIASARPEIAAELHGIRLTPDSVVLETERGELTVGGSRVEVHSGIRSFFQTTEDLISGLRMPDVWPNETADERWASLLLDVGSYAEPALERAREARLRSVRRETQDGSVVPTLDVAHIELETADARRRFTISIGPTSADQHSAGVMFDIVHQLLAEGGARPM